VFFVCTTLLIIFGFLKLPLIVISILFFGIYILYVIFVVYQEVIYKNEPKDHNSDESGVSADTQRTLNEKLNGELNIPLMPPTADIDNSPSDDFDKIERKLQRMPTKQEFDNTQISSMTGSAFRKFMRQYIGNINEKWNNRSVFEKILYFVEYPFHFLMY